MLHLAALLALLVALPARSLVQDPPGDYATLRARAEAFYSEGSFELARRAYEAAAPAARTPDEERWVAFRLADCAWRQAAASKNPDAGPLDEARQQLVEMLELWKRPEEQDDTFASIHESLGDWSWTRENSMDWGTAWTHYSTALEHWAGSSELERARERYLGIVRNVLMPQGALGGRGGSYYGYVPLETIEGAARIANTPDERAWTHYFLAQRMVQSGDARWHARVRESYEVVLEIGRASPWYDEALFQLGVWTEERGLLRHDAERGTWTEPDFVAALALYRRLVNEFREGESAYRRQALERIENITKPQLSVGVGRAYLPGSLQRYHLRWRNVESIELTVHALDLARDVALERGHNPGAWLESVPVERLEVVRGWRYETADTKQHEWGTAELEIEEALPLGAYVLRASAGGESSRDVLLVSESGLVIKSYPGHVALWFAGVSDAEPIAGARVRLFERGGRREQWRSHDATTDGQGLAIIELEDEGDRRRELFAAAVKDDAQAFGMLWGPYDNSAAAAWKLYAYTDRAAYRPGQTVSWKLFARERVDGLLATPAGRALGFELVNPRGELAHEGRFELDLFGGASGAFEPLVSWPLGEYRVRFFLAKGGNQERKDKDADEEKTYLGDSTLFRLEEYKLPEFTVAVELPEDEQGRPRALRLGETIEAAVAAEYYFGGPVAEASVEVLVYQKPFAQHWEPPREYPWYYEERSSGRWNYWGGPGQLVQRETLTTDAAGRARVVIETQFGGGQGLEYTIEARVTDSSRREVSGVGSVRVTQQTYFVYAHVEHALFRPGGSAEIRFHALDANEQPVEVAGRAALVRRRWREVWHDPLGREVRDEELDGLRRSSAVFPPPSTGGRPWSLVRRGYEEETIAKTELRTDAQGDARWTVALPREGFYVARWSSTDEDGAPVQASTEFWVADERTTELGYRQPRLEILADRDTFRAGTPGHVMLSMPASGRHVLFAVESDDLIEMRVVKLEGTVKLLELAVDARWVPNVTLVAHSFSAGYGQSDAVEIVVPPEEHFLDVELALEPQELLPGAKGNVSIVARDSHGEPVEAQVSVALVDEALSAIQGDYAADPRQFFYGEKRQHLVATSSSDQTLGYALLVEDDKGGPRDARELLGLGRRQDEEADLEQGLTGSDDFFKDGEIADHNEMDRAASAPAAAAEAQMDGFSQRSAKDARGKEALGIAGGGAGGAPAEIQVRSDFRETALWAPAVVTGADGRATVAIDYPDSLTNWKATARAATRASAFGTASATSSTRKPLVARLQAPRFFVVGDEVTLSVNLNNRTDEPLAVAPELAVDGLRILGFVDGAELRERAPQSVSVPARGDLRLDWRARAEAPGTARFVVRAVGETDSDALEKTLPVIAHGIEVLEARAGRTEAAETEIALALPAERAPGSTRFTVQVTPSLAVTMLDALPYLVDYPYGCTEQTLSRFLPAVVVKHALEEVGLSPEVAMQRVFGGIEREHVDKTRAHTDASLASLDSIVRAGLERLYDMQHQDGGWSWWKEGDTDAFMTGYVVWGLALAREAGVDVRRDVLDGGARHLGLLLTEAEHEPALAAWMLHAIAAWLPEDGADDERRHAGRMFDATYEKREALNAYGRALLALAATRLGRSDEAQVLARNLTDGAIVDRAPDASIVQRGGAAGGTAAPRAHWGEDGVFHRWSEGGVEATAFALAALIAVDPSHELVDPAAQWLLANRRGAQWKNTRDTAITILALERYMRARNELDRTVEYEVLVNGTSVARKRLTPAEILAAPASFDVSVDLVRSGPNQVLLRRIEGDGPLYFAVHARFFSEEEPIPPRGNELFVRRQYFRLAGRPTLLRGYVYERVPLEDGERVESGERVEVVLSVEAKTHLEYLVFEDHKPAGLEAAQVRSGESMLARELERREAAYRFGAGELERPGVGERVPGEMGGDTGYTGRSRSVHQELRDQKVALFVDRMPEGVWELRYDLRAEVPGRFHALPLVGHAMYVPEIRANGAEIRMEVAERGAAGE